jgi:hypothetical protein
MGTPSELNSPKANALHVEKASTSSLDRDSEHLDDLDSIESTQSGKYAWLVAITAGVGGLLFGKITTSDSNPETFSQSIQVMIPVLSLPSWCTSMMISERSLMRAKRN